MKNAKAKGLSLLLCLCLAMTGCTKGETDMNQKLTDADVVKQQVEPSFVLHFDEGTGYNAANSVGQGESAYVDYVFNDAKYQPDRMPLWLKNGVSGGSLLFDGYSTAIAFDETTLSPGDLSCTLWVAPMAYEWGDKGLPSTLVSQYDSAQNNGFQFGLYRFGS